MGLAELGRGGQVSTHAVLVDEDLVSTHRDAYEERRVFVGHELLLSVAERSGVADEVGRRIEGDPSSKIRKCVRNESSAVVSPGPRKHPRDVGGHATLGDAKLVRHLFGGEAASHQGQHPALT